MNRAQSLASPKLAVRGHLRILLVIMGISAFLFPEEGRAGYAETLGLGAKASSMGSAFAGLADDAFALYYNPAGLVQVKGRSIEGVCVIGATKRKFISGGVDIQDKNPVTVGPLLLSTANFGIDNFMFAGGQVASMGGYSIVDEFQGDTRYSSYNVQFTVLPLLFGGGYRLNDWLSIGATLQIGIMNKSWQAQRLGDGFLGRTVGELGIPFSTVNGVDDGKLEIQSDKEFPTGLKPLNTVNIDGRSFSYLLGLLLRPFDSLQIGLTFREKLRTHYEGTARQELAQDIKENLGFLLDLLGMPAVQEARFKLLLILPRQIDLGLAWFATEKLTITTDYVWTNWSTWKDQTIGLEGSGISGMNAISVNRFFSDTHSVRMGVQYALTPVVRLRAGYFWDPTPIPERTLDMTTVDSDRHIFTCGLGLMGLFEGKVNLESYFQVLDFVKRTIQPGESENLGGTKISLNNRRNDTELQIDGNVFHAGLSFTLFY